MRTQTQRGSDICPRSQVKGKVGCTRSVAGPKARLSLPQDLNVEFEFKRKTVSREEAVKITFA